MKCSYCNSELKNNASFCIACGHKVENRTAFCYKCGARLENNAKFCTCCGTNQNRVYNIKTPMPPINNPKPVGKTSEKLWTEIPVQSKQPPVRPSKPVAQKNTTVVCEKGKSSKNCMVGILSVILCAALCTMCYFGGRSSALYEQLIGISTAITLPSEAEKETEPVGLLELPTVMEYEDFEIVTVPTSAQEEIRIEETESEILIETTEAPVQETVQTEFVQEAGIRAEFKEAMDSYEAFYNGYCKFMTEYKENPTNIMLISNFQICGIDDQGAGSRRSI